MKKRLLCIVIALVMIMQCMPVAFAKNVSESLDVNLDLTIRQSGTANEFVNGPINITSRDSSVDVRATLQMSTVYNKFMEWYNYANKIIDNMVALDKSLSKATLVNELNNLKVEGEFEVKAYIPKGIEIPANYTDSTLLNMNGFNEEAKEVFYEKSRTLDTTDAEYNVITVKVGVTDKNDTEKGLLVGKLYENRAKYLKDITFTAYNLHTTEAGLYTFKGTLEGNTSTNGTVGSKETVLSIDYKGVQKRGGQNTAASDISATFSLNKPTYSINGNVITKDEDGNVTPIEDAKVTLKEGIHIIHEMTTDVDGHYGFEGVPVGIYNVVVEYNGTIKTKLVYILDHNEDHIDLEFEENVNSILDFGTEDETTATVEPPKVIVDNINEEAKKEAEAEKENEGVLESVEVKMTVSEKEEVKEETPTTTQRQEVKETQERIKQEAIKEPEEPPVEGQPQPEEPKTIIDKFFEIVVEKTIKKQAEPEKKEEIKETAVVLHIVIPYNMKNKKDIKVYRDHEGLVELLSELASQPLNIEDYVDGTVYLDKKGGYIHIYAQKFSMYAITYVEVEPEEPEINNDPGRPSSGGGGSLVNLYDVKFNIDGDTTYVAPLNKSGLLKLSELPVPQKEGYTFDGWYFDSEFKNKVTEDIKITKDTVLYGHFISNILHTEDHFAYIIGYPDGTIKPQENITREEVVTIFYRLLKDDERQRVYLEENPYIDVESDRWSNKYISTLSNGSYVKGYEDGSFKPANYITRAEFATMATRFAHLEKVSSLTSFSDIAGHWAMDYILKATDAGWIRGYEDGSFAPDKYITRAETMAIINRILVRSVNEEGFNADAKIWSDIVKDDWYYYIVEEATNSHTYTRQEDGKNEIWNEITENKVW